MIRLGMHASLWLSAWTREAAERAVAETARHGMRVIEIPLLEPDKVDVAHSRALFERHAIAPTASLGLPREVEATQHPEAATAFLLRALEVAHQLGSNTLSGVTYSTIGHRTGAPPSEAEYANMAKALKPVAKRAGELGMSLGIEPCNRYETHLMNTGQDGAWFVEQAGAENVFIHLDT